MTISTFTLRSLPVLLSSSIIAHDQGVSLKDTNSRLRHTVESVENWLRLDPNLAIVLCDGSGFDIKSVIESRFLGANIEYLKFENDPALVVKFGRGYGEGEIIKYALKNSREILGAGCFVKCSAKLWVRNIHECLNWWNGDFLCKGVFLEVFSPFKKTEFHHIDTRFYVASKSFYEQYFMDAHQKINVEVGYGLEECFCDVLKQSRIRGALLPVPSIIEGVGGGTAKYYRNSTSRVFKERLRLALVRDRLEFSPLFADGNHVRTHGNSLNFQFPQK